MADPTAPPPPEKHSTHPSTYHHCSSAANQIRVKFCKNLVCACQTFDTLKDNAADQNSVVKALVFNNKIVALKKYAPAKIDLPLAS